MRALSYWGKTYVRLAYHPLCFVLFFFPYSSTLIFLKNIALLLIPSLILTLSYAELPYIFSNSELMDLFSESPTQWLHKSTYTVHPLTLLALHHGGLSASTHCSPFYDIPGRILHTTHLFSSFWKKKKMVVSSLFITACSSGKPTLQNCRVLYGNCIALCSNTPSQVDNITCLTLSLTCNFSLLLSFLYKLLQNCGINF